MAQTCLGYPRLFLGMAAIGRGIAQPGRALSSGGRGRRFESSFPDHYKNMAGNCLVDAGTTARRYYGRYANSVKHFQGWLAVKVLVVEDEEKRGRLLRTIDAEPRLGEKLENVTGLRIVVELPEYSAAMIG